MAALNPFETEMFTVTYTSNLQLLLQQEMSKLRGLVDTGAHTGAKMVSPVQQIAPLEFKQIGGRGSPITYQNTAYTRRWVTPQDRDCGTLIDSFDQLKTI